MEKINRIREIYARVVRERGVYNLAGLKWKMHPATFQQACKEAYPEQHEFDYLEKKIRGFPVELDWEASEVYFGE